MHSRIPFILGALCFLICLVGSKPTDAQLVLDSAFSFDGMRIDTNTNTDPYPIYYQKIIELPDGSYVGGAHNGIHKVLVNGNKDMSFGVDGDANFPTISGYQYDGVLCVKSIAMQRDGKIVVLAQVKYNEVVSPFMCLMRYNANGFLDNSFHETGYFVDSLSGHSTEPWAMTIDTVTNPGKDVIYLCGTYGHCVNLPGGGSYCSDGFFVMAVGPDGNYETSFKQGGTWTGYVIPYHQSGQDYFTSIHVISPDNILLSGVTLANTYAYFALKINSLGDIDSTFGTNGLWEKTDTLFSFSRFAFTKRLGADKILLFHSSGYDSDSTFITYRCFDTNGHTVTSFGQDGSVVQSLNLHKDYGSFNMWFPIAIDSSERIYTCLYSKPSTTSYVHILRMLPDGSRDASFGNNGLLVSEPIRNDNCINGNIMYDAICSRNNKLVLAFLKDYNINAMSFGGGIYRFMEKPEFPNTISEIPSGIIQISVANRQLLIRSDLSGICQVGIYSLNGQSVYSASACLNPKQLSKLSLPLLSSGIYIAEVIKGQKRETEKIFIGD
ncbi:MAG: delta-60 repeat domain-containing protein [Bacteroidetes bacterium]|nr:delta-60 repeat domain-containing protein [Bacteroidota bacterium]